MHRLAYWADSLGETDYHVVTLGLKLADVPSF
jgi:hypothetical protein